MDPVTLARGSMGFTPLSKALLVAERDSAALRVIADHQPGPDVQDDQMLERTHKIISDSRKDMCGRIFASYNKRKNLCRVWWVKSKEFGVTKVDPVYLDANQTCSRLTLTFKIVCPQFKIDKIVGDMVADGWETAHTSIIWN